MKLDPGRLTLDVRYVLSTTHLHEFKSADKGQAPIMSLYLPEQKLGSHSSGEGTSNKFVLKGRQTGAMHRGHTWVFRAESYDTMMAWYEDIKALTEKSPEERSQFVRTHSRSLSQSSRRSASSDGGLVDDDDDEPFSASTQMLQANNEYNANLNNDLYASTQQQHQQYQQQQDPTQYPPGQQQQQDGPFSPYSAAPADTPRRSQPGGRFPSDIQVNAQRGLHATRSTSSMSSANRNTSEESGRNVGGSSNNSRTAAEFAAATAGVAGVGAAGYAYGRDDEPSNAALANQQAQQDGVNPYTGEQEEYPVRTLPAEQQAQPQEVHDDASVDGKDHTSNATTYMAPAAILAAAQQRKQQSQQQVQPQDAPVQYADAATGSGAPEVVPEAQKEQVEEIPGRPVNQSTRNDSIGVITSHMPGGYPRNGTV